MTEQAISRLDRWRIVSNGALASLAALAGIAAQTLAYVHLAQRTDLSGLDKWARGFAAAEFAPALLIALVVVWRGEASRGVRTWALALALTGLNGALWALLADHPPFDTTLLKEVASLSFWPAIALFLRSSQDFPQPLKAADFARGGRAWRSLPWLRLLLRALLHPLAAWALILGFFLASSVLPAWANHVGKLLIVALETAYWRAQWQVGDATRRRQVGWLLQGALTYLVLSLLNTAALGVVGAQPTMRVIVSLTCDVLATVLLNLCIALAIFRTGVVNPALVLRRTFVYGVAAAGLTMGLEFGVHLAADTLKETLAVSDRLQGAVIGTVAGLAFAPLSHRLRKLFDRLSERHAQASHTHAPAQEPAAS